jgi:hypothetical protein
VKAPDGSKTSGAILKVSVRIGELQINAIARVLDRHADHELWDDVAAIADRKYGWGGGLPVEIMPTP